MDVSKIDEEIANDELSMAVPINKKNDEPYVGANGEDSTISVTGTDAKKYKRVRERIQKRAYNRTGKLEPAEVMKNRIDLAVAGSTGWSGWEANGEPLPFSEEDLRTLLKAEHILEQVERGIKRHADFFVKS
jgi:hypothetical protein